MSDYSFTETLATAPASEPVSATDAKTFVRQDSSADDTLIGTLITSARMWVENYLNRSLITQTWVQRIDYGFPCHIWLRRVPAIAITSIAYLDTAGDSQTLSSSVYSLDQYREPHALVYLAYGQTWPATQYVRQAVTVTYTAGYGANSTDVPQAIITAIKQLILHWYDNRNPVVTGTVSKSMEMMLKAILDPYRVFPA